MWIVELCYAFFSKRMEAIVMSGNLKPARLAVYGAGIKDGDGSKENPFVAASPVDQIKYAKEMGFLGVQLNISPSDLEAWSELDDMAQELVEASLSHGVYIVGFGSGSPGPWIFDPNEKGFEEARRYAREGTGFIDVTTHPVTGEDALPSWSYENKVHAANEIIELGGKVGQGRVFSAHAGHFLDSDGLSDGHGASQVERANYDMITEALDSLSYTASDEDMFVGLETGPDNLGAMAHTVNSIDEEGLLYQFDTANQAIWGNQVHYLVMLGYLKAADKIVSVHLKGQAALEGDAPDGSWQAREVDLDHPDNRVDLDQVLYHVRDIETPFDTPVSLSIEREVSAKNLSERLEALSRVGAFVRGRMDHVGGYE
tara:strand:+ start:2869 stop:3981 length:1113 start_codon:yes stop_codon:yes gene_type:complete